MSSPWIPAPACHTRSMRAKAKRAKSRKATGQNAGQLESSYGYAAAMSSLHERAMDRWGETRSAIRHRPGFRLRTAGAARRKGVARCGTRERRMRLLPEGIDEMSANFRWGVEWRLRMIEEVVCAPQGSRTGGPGMEESMERARRAAQRGDTEAEDAAFVAAMTAEVREG